MSNITAMKNAALYIRVSTDAQAEEGYSIDAQKEMLASYCKIKSISSYEFYIDAGYTGSNIERPEMRRLINDVTRGKIDRVIVYKLDRLSRSQKDTLYLIEDVLNLHNAEFVSINENLDTSTPIGRAMLGIMSAFAQLERETIRERTRMGMKERVKTGLWMGGGRVPFGYDYNKEQGILVPNKDAETVKKIYDLYLQGFSLQKISDMLGLKYDKLALQILTRKTNTGVICYNNNEYAGKHEPIISPETYSKAMEMMKERSITHTVTSDHLLQGLIICGKCGAKMHYKKWGKRGFKIYCYSQQKSKKYLIKDPNCDNKRHWSDEIDEVVITDLLNMSWCNLSRHNPKEQDISPLELMAQQYKRCAEKLKRLYNLYSEAADDILLQSINELKAEMKKIDAQIEGEREKSIVTNQMKKTKEMLSGISDMWGIMSFREKQNIVRNAVEKVVITDDAIDVYYKFLGKIKEN